MQIPFYGASPQAAATVLQSGTYIWQHTLVACDSSSNLNVFVIVPISNFRAFVPVVARLTRFQHTSICDKLRQKLKLYRQLVGQCLCQYVCARKAHVDARDQAMQARSQLCEVQVRSARCKADIVQM